MEDSMGRRRNLKDFLLNQNPWVLLFIFLSSIGFTVIAFMSNIKTFQCALPSYSELQVIEGTVENFSKGPGRNNVFFELALNNKTYYLNENLVWNNNLSRVIQKDSHVKIWIDNNYKNTFPNYENSFPNQVYAITIDGNECLLYEDSCNYLKEYYKDSLKDGNRIMFLSFIACAYVCASFAVQLLSKH